MYTILSGFGSTMHSLVDSASCRSDTDGRLRMDLGLAATYGGISFPRSYFILRQVEVAPEREPVAARPDGDCLLNGNR